MVRNLLTSGTILVPNGATSRHADKARQFMEARLEEVDGWTAAPTVVAAQPVQALPHACLYRPEEDV